MQWPSIFHNGVRFPLNYAQAEARPKPKTQTRKTGI